VIGGPGIVTATATATSRIVEVTLDNNTASSQADTSAVPTSLDLSVTQRWQASPNQLPRLEGYIGVANNGPAVAFNVRVEGQLPEQARILATGQGAQYCTAPRSEGATFTCIFPVIPPGEMRFHFEVELQERETPDPGTLTILSWTGVGAVAPNDVDLNNNVGPVFRFLGP
jgi:hypothetical protein